MGKIYDIIRRNKFYTVLTVFIILINLAIYVGKVSEKAETPETAEQVAEAPVEEERALFPDEEEAKERHEKIDSLAKENPKLYIFLALFNLFILFLIFVGLLLDGYFIGRWLRKRPIEITGSPLEKPRWNMADVVRVTLIFVSFGYIFVILQAFVEKQIPLMHNENFRMIFDTAVMNVVGISVIIYFIVKKYNQQISALGLTMKGFLRNVFYAIIGYISLIPVLLVIMMVTFVVVKWLQYKPPLQPIVEVFLEEKQTSVLLISTLFAAIFGPIAEEIFFRGFMYGAIKKTFGIFWAMIITAAIFSFLHTHIVGFLPIMALGLLLAYLYEKTGSLVSCMAVHIVHNIGMVILVFMARGIGV
ncbi:MAG: type II CAAX endopeptidase family protein [Candidatus Omnitrophota bacterium]